MARINICGFEMQTTSGTTDFNTATNVIINSGLDFVNGKGKYGRYSALISGDGATSSFVAINGHNAGGIWANYNKATIYTGFYLYKIDNFTAEEIIYSAYTGGLGLIKGELRINSAQQLVFYGSGANIPLGTGATVLENGRYYLIECKVGSSATVGEWEIRVNKQLEMSGTANLAAANNVISRYGKFLNRNSSNVRCYIDDIVIDDTNFPSGGYISMLSPKAIGPFNSLDVIGAANIVSATNEAPYDFTTYVDNGTNTLGTGTVYFQPCHSGHSGFRINCIKQVNVVRDTGGSTGAYAVLFAETGAGWSFETSATNLSTSFQAQAQILNTDSSRNDQKWFVNTVNGVFAGCSSTLTPFYRCTNIQLMVEYFRDSPRKGLLGLGK